MSDVGGAGGLPFDLVESLHRTRDLEAVAERVEQQRQVIAASGALMLAAVYEGWTITAMAGVLGIRRQAASKRVAVARARLGGVAPRRVV